MQTAYRTCARSGDWPGGADARGLPEGAGGERGQRGAGGGQRHGDVHRRAAPAGRDRGRADGPRCGRRQGVPRRASTPTTRPAEQLEVGADGRQRQGRVRRRLVKLIAADTKALKGEGSATSTATGCATARTGAASPPRSRHLGHAHRGQGGRDDEGLPGVRRRRQRRDTFDLVKTPAGWRIHDMGTRDEPSLRDVLTKEIAELKAEKSQPANQVGGPPP